MRVFTSGGEQTAAIVGIARPSRQSCSHVLHAVPHSPSTTRRGKRLTAALAVAFRAPSLLLPCGGLVFLSRVNRGVQRWIVIHLQLAVKLEAALAPEHLCPYTIKTLRKVVPLF